MSNHPANSFTFVRYCLASLVIFSHSFSIGGYQAKEPVSVWSQGFFTIGLLAVMAFFIISGFLLTGSLQKKPPIASYLLHRAFRIFPAFWVSLLISAFLILPVLMQIGYPGKYGYWESLFQGANTIAGFAANNWFLKVNQYSVDLALAGNPYANVVNGALWSLYYEAICYVLLACFFLLGGLRRTWPVVGLCALWYVLVFFSRDVLEMGAPFFNTKVGGFFKAVFANMTLVLAFFSGALFRVFWGRILLKKSIFFAAVIALIVASREPYTWTLLWPLLLPYVILYLAHGLPLSRFDRFGDSSYGVYIYGFLIQQSLVVLGCHKLGFVTYFGVSLVVSTVFGLLSWHYLEKPCIGLGRRFTSELEKWKNQSPT